MTGKEALKISFDFMMKYYNSTKENMLEISINSDIKEYYDSFWFLSLSVPMHKRNYIMKPVRPGKELFGVMRQWQEYHNFFQR